MSNRKTSPSRTEGALTIHWLTDIHIDDSVDGNPEAPRAIRHNVLYIYTGSTKLQKFVDRVNKDLPDLAICTGDIVDSYSLYIRTRATKGRKYSDSVSEDLPDLGIHSEDVIDSSRDLATFKKWWNTIDSTVQKYVTIGNHDVMAAPRDDIVGILGYEARTTIAGSKFNYAFSIRNDHTSARVLMVDTTVGADPDIWCYTGRLLGEAQNWISDELASCSENVVLLYMHHGPHACYEPDPIGQDPRITQFDTTDALDLQFLVDSAITSRPHLKVRCLFGHAHTDKSVRRFSNLGANLPGYLNPCAIDFNPGLFSIIKLFPDGSLEFETISVSHP